MTSPHSGLQRLMDEAPYVRLLARQLLAEEADDVVQQTWLQAIQHGGDRVESPRAWLARIVRNVATSVHRGRARQRRQQHSSGDEHLVPSSAELMQQEEQRRMLIAAVDRLPGHLRTVVLLRYFEGLTPHVIARRLNAPTTTVWNQLRRALQLLRERLDAEHGGQRRAWLLPLVPFAAGTNGLPWAAPALPATAVATVGMGVITMTMKTKLVAVIAAMLTVTAALALWATRDSVPSQPDATIKVVERAAVETSSMPRDAVAAATAEGTSTQREAVPMPATATSPTGTLVLHVRYGDDKAPAAGVMMIVRRPGTDARVEGRRQRTDSAGTVRFETLPPGRLVIASDRGNLGKRADIIAGETTELDYEFEVGLHVTGIVVDASDAPMANALIEVAPLATSDADAEVLATSGADGRFSVRGAPTATLVGARAEGHGASPMKFLLGKDGNQAEVRLQLGPPSGSVEGIVVDERGQPIAGAVVRVGSGQTSGIVARNDGAPPLPALVRSDDQGRFRAIGVPPGHQPVVARASGQAPWQGTCDVAANLAAPLRIELGPGATIRGRVNRSAGTPAAKAEVEVGRWDDFAHYRTFSKEDGCFELSGLPAGEILLLARHDDFGKAEQRVHTEAGTTSICDLLLSRGLELRGRVVDETGAPIAKAFLECLATSGAPSWFAQARTDAEGGFAVPNCVEGSRLSVTVKASGFEELLRTGVDPCAAIDLPMRRSLPATVRITGVVVAPDGKPLPNAMVSARRQGAQDSSGVIATGPDGRFECRALVPGTWTVTVRTSTHPNFTSEPRELAADAVWDLGTILLLDGGNAIVTVDGDQTGVYFRVVDVALRNWTSLTNEGKQLVSQKLAPGDHQLLVSGKTVAAQSIPFTVRTGEATQLAVKLAPGVRQRIEMASAILAPLPRGVSIRVHRGVQLIAYTGVSSEANQQATGEVCLPPGDYTLTAFDGDRQLASAAFSVGTTEAPPLRLELR